MLAETLDNNPQILLSMANERGAGQDLAYAMGGYYPRLSLSAGIGHENTDSPNTRSAGQGEVELTRREAGIMAKQMLFDGFATAGEVDKNTYLHQSERFRVEAVKEAITLQTTQRYLDVLRNRKRLGQL